MFYFHILGYDGLCGDFINARDKGMVLLQNIRGKTRYTEDANTYRFFDNNGNLPTKYFNYNGELDTFTYVSVNSRFSSFYIKFTCVFYW
jgi:hypothetical protein